MPRGKQYIPRDPHVTMDYCPWCGLGNARIHNSYKNMCEDCGRKYSRYKTYCRYKKAGSITVKQIDMLDELSDYYKMMAQRGYRVPKEFKGNIIR